MTQDPLTRRKMLKLGLGLGAFCALPLTSQAFGLVKLNKNNVAAQKTKALMNTVVSVTIVDESQTRAQQSLAMAFQEMERLVFIFDRHSPKGLINQLNRNGSLQNPPSELNHIIKLSQAIKIKTQGAFDISIAPVLDLVAQSFAQTKNPPTIKKINQALSSLGGFSFDSKGIRLTCDRAALTLDGIAKGFIADQGLKAAKAQGARNILINAGGDIVVKGYKNPNINTPWKIGLADPDSPQKPISVIEMTSGACATSGNYEVFFDKEKIFHHIIAPNKGNSPTQTAQASVLAPNGALADALSTASMVLGPEKAFENMAQFQGVKGMVISPNGRVLKSRNPGFGLTT